MDWQEIAALAIVAAAFLWLLRSQLLHRGEKSGCGACSQCHSAAPAPPALISLEELPVLPPTPAAKPPPDRSLSRR